MLFKDVTELPPPRYAMDDDDEEVQMVETEYGLTVEGQLGSLETLIVVAPRVIGLRSELTRTLLATVNLSITQTMAQHYAQDFDEQEVEFPSGSLKRTIKASIHSGPGGTAVLALPVLEAAEAAFFAKALMRKLDTKQIIVAAPGTVHDGVPVCCIGTSSAHLPARIPAAVPPVIVQGAAAAILSQAQQLNIPAIGYIVSSDGPPNHEAILPSHYEALREALHGSLDIGPRSGPEVSTLYV